jgi:hypothetical protein
MFVLYTYYQPESSRDRQSSDQSRLLRVTRPPVDWTQMERLRPCSIFVQLASIPMYATVLWYKNNTCRISCFWLGTLPVCTVTIQWSPRFPTVCRWDYAGYNRGSGTVGLSGFMAYLRAAGIRQQPGSPLDWAHAERLVWKRWIRLVVRFLNQWEPI